MTKTFKSICAVLVCALLALTLMSCSAEKKYEKYAEQIRVAEAKEEALTYEEVIEKLGEATIDNTSAGDLFGMELKRVGVAYWYAGCESEEDLNAKLEAGKEVPWIKVTFADGVATDATTGVKAPDAE